MEIIRPSIAMEYKVKQRYKHAQGLSKPMSVVILIPEVTLFFVDPHHPRHLGCPHACSFMNTARGHDYIDLHPLWSGAPTSSMWTDYQLQGGRSGCLPGSDSWQRHAVPSPGTLCTFWEFTCTAYFELQNTLFLFPL